MAGYASRRRPRGRGGRTMAQLKVGQRVRVAGVGLAGPGATGSDLTGTVVAVDAVRQWVAVTFDGVAGQPTVLLPSTKVRPIDAEEPQEPEEPEMTLSPVELG